MSQTKYNWEFLSIARFLLASIVLLGHLKSYANIGLLDWYTKFGSFEAILGFLLISGFSIGKSIKKNQESYFLRRAERIYPVYLASLLLFLVVIPSSYSMNLVITFIVNLFFLNQILTSTSLVGPAWSLALEVWLYAFAPLLLKASYKLLIFLICISFISYISYTLGRTLYHWPYYSGTKFGLNLILLSFTWIAGFGLAVHEKHFDIFSKTIAAIFILHISLAFFIQLLHRLKHHQLHDFLVIDLIIYIMGAICLLFVFYLVVLNYQLPQLSLKPKKIFNLLGNISYPMYLIHVSIFDLFRKFSFLNAPVMIISALFASYIIYFIFDFYSRKRVIA